MGKRGLQQVGCIVTDEFRICHVRIIDDRRVIQRCMYRVGRNQLNHSSKKQALQFEATLVIRIGQDEKGVLQNAEIVLLEELIGYLSLRRGEVVDNFQGNCGEGL